MPTLLLADENVTVQRVIALTFAAEEIRVVTVNDGTQAVERMKTLHPDIVLAGTLLPRLSGYDLAKHMRGIPGLKNVPVLLLSGAFETVDEEKLKASGANGVIEKPVEPNNVIARVRELLGLKAGVKPVAAGRLAASADRLADPRHMPVATPPPIATATLATAPKLEQPSHAPVAESDTTPADDAPTRRDDYLDTLDTAFDTLDQQLSAQEADAKPSRNPSGPLGQSSGAPDPRSPGRRPHNDDIAPGNPVFEVDDEWFGTGDSEARDAARAGRREIQDDLHDPALQTAAPDASANPIFEVDEEWFADDNKARAVKADQQRALAAEMGIHDVEFAEAIGVTGSPAPASNPDFDFGIEDFKALQGTEPRAIEPETAPEVSAADVEASALADWGLPEADAPDSSTPAAIVPVPPSAPAAFSATVAADFAQLLAFEQGEHSEPMPALPEIRVVAPEVTDQMLEQLAVRVADRLSSGVFAELLKDAMMTTVRDTVRVVAYETAERIVGEVARESTDRIVRDVANQASERIVREVATDAAGRVVRDVASATSERIVRDAAEASERIAHEVAFQASERIIRDVASEASQRIARDVAAATSREIVRDVVSETSERLVREEIERIKSKHQ